MKQGIGPVIGRAISVIAGLLVVGIALRLITTILEPVLPATFWRDLNAGWDKFFSIIGPAMPGIMAVLVLGALIWIVAGRRQ